MAPTEKPSATRDARALPPIVEAMLRPAFYPEPPAEVELIQTHISYVFVAGAFVYKLKKPVRFSFLDCADLEQRRHLCAEEIRLNRRLAPDVYLGMYPVIRAGADFVLGEKAPHHPNAVEYVVKMRRLPEECMLDAMLSRHEVDRATIRRLASVIVNYSDSASSIAASRYGTAAELWRLVIGELVEVERLVGFTVNARKLPTIENFCRRFLTAHWKMLNTRVEVGRVREGHGDLRCEHICIEDGKISIFDCVEFSERLRTCDIASEVAFLAMDLDRLGASELADELVGAATEAAHDDELPRLMPFYKCYRAIIRGVVESLRGHAVEVGQTGQLAAIELASRYFELAYSYAIDAAPAMMVVCGLSGSGKSTLARALQNRFGFPIISSDRTRKKLSSIPAERHAEDAYKAGIYAEAVTEETYAAMLDEAAYLLQKASGVILDATYQDRSHRKAARELASRLKVPILFIECRAEDAEIRRRLIERQKTASSPSDATVDVYLRQREEFVDLSEIPIECHLMVDTARPYVEIVNQAKTAIEGLNR